MLATRSANHVERGTCPARGPPGRLRRPRSGRLEALRGKGQAARAPARAMR